MDFDFSDENIICIGQLPMRPYSSEDTADDDEGFEVWMKNPFGEFEKIDFPEQTCAENPDGCHTCKAILPLLIILIRFIMLILFVLLILLSVSLLDGCTKAVDADYLFNVNTYVSTYVKASSGLSPPRNHRQYPPRAPPFPSS